MERQSTPQLVHTGPERYETGLVHRILMPAGPGPYPTVVLLHGRMGDEDVMWVFRKSLPQHWLMVAPRAPLADPNGNYSWLVQPFGFWPTLDEFEPPVSALLRFVDALPRVYNADPDRLYFMGFSQGAAVAYGAALTRPGVTQGIAGLVGFTPLADAADVAGRLAGLPVFMAAGTEDQRVPPDQADRSAALLRAAGADVDYRTYDTGHKMTPDALRDLQAWWRGRA